MRISCCLALVFVGAMTVSGQLQTSGNRFFFDQKTGALTSVFREQNQVVVQTENHYFLKSRKGDAEAFERDDKVIAAETRDNALLFRCRNAGLPDLEIDKTWWIDGAYLRREITFRNLGAEKVFLTTRTRVAFTPEFYQDGYYLGAGYIGPLTPVPKLTSARKVTTYKHTTKAMLLYHDSPAGSFAQYRTKLNGRFVYPWWLSGIPNYIEEENYLYYHPDGWEMSLGTIDVEARGSFRIEDCFVAFAGAWSQFINEIYTGDPVVHEHLGSLKPGPQWLQDVRTYVYFRNLSDIEKLDLLLKDGDIMVLTDSLGDWGDYRVWRHDHSNGYTGQRGGKISGQENREFLARIKALSPRVKIGSYMFLNSGMAFSPIVRERPEYFMLKDRQGRDKNLFPGTFVHNFPTMVNRPGVIDYLVNEVMAGYIDTMGVDFIYLDETKATNLIDWQKMDLVRDDHWNDFWESMYHLGKKKDVVMFGNARGNPYHELNFIEASHQLNPRNWREFVGMAMAVANFVDHRAGGRLCLLYWRDNVDYIDRVLANGFIPALNPFRLRQIPYLSALHEQGPLRVQGLRYAPDWKNDPQTKLESYCSQRRNGSETIYSFINRSDAPDIEISLDLCTFPANLSIWECRIERYQDKVTTKYVLGEKDRQKNYRKYRWREGLITSPKMLYSGKNPGLYRHVLSNLGTDCMAQVVVSPAPAGVYAIDDLPQNYFYAATPLVQISGEEFPLTVSSAAERAEIIVFAADAKLRVNQADVVCEYVDFAGKLYPLVQLEKGTHQISLAGKMEHSFENAHLEVADGRIIGSKGLISIRRGEQLLYCGSSPKIPPYTEGGLLTAGAPGQAPVELAVKPGKPTPAMQVPAIPYIPAESDSTPAEVALDGAIVREARTFKYRWRNESGVQPGLAPFIADADPATLTLECGTSNRIEDYLGHAAAAFLLENVKKVQLHLSHTFNVNSGIERGHVNRYRRSPTEFAGLMLDYQTPQGFSRVALSMGVLHSKPAPGMHPWGSQKSAEEIYLLGNWLDQPGERHFTLDLERYAPANWSGKVYLTAATSFLMPGRLLKLTLEHCNQRASAPECIAVNQTTFFQELRKPRSLQVPFLQEVTPENLQAQGASGGNFVLIQHRGLPAFSTSFRLARDAEHLHTVVQYKDQDSSNEIEVWGCPKNSRDYRQVIVGETGEITCYRNGGLVRETDVRVQKIALGHYYISIPLSWLGLTKDTESCLFNVCRTRQSTLTHPIEHSCWSVLEKGYADIDNFGSIAFEPPR